MIKKRGDGEERKEGEKEGEEEKEELVEQEEEEQEGGEEIEKEEAEEQQENSVIYASDPMPGRRVRQPALRRERSVRSGHAKFAAGNSRKNRRPRRGCSPACRAQPVIGARSSGTRAAGRSRATVCT